MPRARKSREQLDEEWAARKNARNAERWALWAAAGRLDDVVAPAKASDIADFRRSFEENMAAGREKNRRKALLYRAAALAVVAPEVVADRDHAIAHLYPKDPVYACDAWCQAISKATGRTPTEVYREIEGQYDRLAERTSDVARPATVDLAGEIRAALKPIATEGP